MPQRGLDFAAKIGNSACVSAFGNRGRDYCTEAHRYSNIASLDE